MPSYIQQYQFLLYPLLLWLWTLLQAYALIPCHLSLPNDELTCTFMPPPVFDAEVLFTIIIGMLGIGGMRSYDKTKKVATQQL